MSARIPTPYLALRSVLGPVAKHILESQNVSCNKVIDAGFQYQFGNLEKSITKRVPKLKGTEKQFIFEQWVPKTKEEVFPFFAEAKNLEKITPSFLKFKVTGMKPDKIEKDAIINYQLKLQGIPLKWKTRIVDWSPPNFFSDNQESGPYSKWFHQHHFKSFGGGTLMTDIVNFKIPLGLIGYGVSQWKVISDIDKIFQYRRETIYKKYS